MKKVIFLASVLLTICSCNNDASDTQINGSTNSINPAHFAKINNIDIDFEELPELDSKSLEKLGFDKFEMDYTRLASLDLANSVLTVPYDAARSSRSVSADDGGIKINIKIARKHIKPKHVGVCSSCVDCLGFGCSFSATEDNSFQMSETFMEKIASERGAVSNLRDQDVYVYVDITNSLLVYYFKENIDWGAMEPIIK